MALATSCLVPSLILQSGYPGDDGRRPAGSPEAAERPNIVFVLADDLDARSIEHMPALQSLMVEEGATFVNAFATHSLCCPSRASILTGQHPHNHKVETNTPNGDRELYDLSADPYELGNPHGSAGPTLEERLQTRLDELRGCAGEGCREGEPHLETLDPLAGEDGEPPDPDAARIASGGKAVYAKENRPDEAGEIPVSRHRSESPFPLPMGK